MKRHELQLPANIQGMWDHDTLKGLKQKPPGEKSRSAAPIRNRIYVSNPAHAAVEDVSALCGVLKKAAVGDSYLTKHAFTSDSTKALYGQQHNTCLPTLKPLVAANVLTSFMATKLAGSGLKLCHLWIAHTHDESAKFFLEDCNRLKSTPD